MSKFDRCIFISIAIGIWAIVLIQIFAPSSLIAHTENDGGAKDHFHTAAQIIDFELGYLDDLNEMKINICKYIRNC